MLDMPELIIQHQVDGEKSLESSSDYLAKKRKSGEEAQVRQQLEALAKLPGAFVDGDVRDEKSGHLPHLLDTTWRHKRVSGLEGESITS